MITTIVISIIVILVVAYFLGASEEDNDTQIRKITSTSAPSKLKKVYDVVKIDNPKLNVPGDCSIHDQSVASYRDENTKYDVSISRMSCTCVELHRTLIQYRQIFVMNADPFGIQKYSQYQ